MTAEKRVDIVVVGAGPAGSIAAARLARAKAKVLLVEKKNRVGTPVRCAEGVGGEALRKYVSIQPEWISAQIETVRLFAPDGGSVQLGQDILDLFLWYTATLAADRHYFKPVFCVYACQGSCFSS